MGHVFVVASGFRMRVIPKSAPFQFWIDGAGLIVECGGARAKIESSHDLIAAQTAAAGCADVEPGPDWPEWWLETHPYRVPLPYGWRAQASGGVEPAAFDLLGPHDSLVFVQMPRHVPPIDQLVAPGQNVVGRGSSQTAEWITVDYEHDGRSYRQRLARVGVGAQTAVVTLQTSPDHFDEVEPDFSELVSSITTPR